MNIKEYNIDKDTPFKWKKHLILPMFGLRTIEEVQEEVHRYKTQEISFMIDDIKQDMQNSREKSVYLISFIPKSQAYKLPNISISSMDELDAFYKKYLHTDNKQYAEIWFFKKFRNKNFNNSIGRISINNRDIYDNMSYFQNSHTIEQVWSSSHREIEKYNDESRVVFLGANRIGWNRKYKINRLYIPPSENLDTNYILSQFNEAVREIELQREKIEEFSEYLKSLDIKSFSLEYMLREGKFSFIDWDSENDIKIVNSLLKNKQLERDR